MQLLLAISPSHSQWWKKKNDDDHYSLITCSTKRCAAQGVVRANHAWRGRPAERHRPGLDASRSGTGEHPQDSGTPMGRRLGCRLKRRAWPECRLVSMWSDTWPCLPIVGGRGLTVTRTGTSHRWSATPQCRGSGANHKGPSSRTCEDE